MGTLKNLKQTKKKEKKGGYEGNTFWIHGSQ